MSLVNSEMVESCHCCQAEHVSNTLENAKISGLWSVKITKFCPCKTIGNAGLTNAFIRAHGQMRYI